MFEFFQTEIRAYSAAAKRAAAAYETGDLKTAQQSQATAVIGCATVTRYLSDPFFAEPLSEEERRELASAVGNLRASLEGIETRSMAAVPALSAAGAGRAG